jgi:hypothetical protein
MAEVEWFAELLKETLSGVGFFVDYVQLHFNLNPLLNIYTPVVVAVNGTNRSSGQPEFANALIGQIRKAVVRVAIEPEDRISIHFRDASTVSFSTRSERSVSEAFTLFTESGVYEE